MHLRNRPAVTAVCLAAALPLLATSCSEERADPDDPGSTTTAALDCEGSSVVECAPA
jgi:hypothetical protein